MISHEDEGVSDVLRHADQLIVERARAGDPECQFALSMNLIKQSIDTLNADLLNEAEQWLHEAAKNGSKDASEFLENSWQRAKQTYRGRIDRQLGKDSGHR